MTETFDNEFWSGRLRAGHLRVTRSRLDVMRALSSSPEPMTAQGVLDTIGEDNADRVTVYRTLNSLVDAGMAHKLDPGDRVWRYGLLLNEPEKAARPGAKHADRAHEQSHGRDAMGVRAPGAPPAGPAHGHAHFVCDACGTVRCLDNATVTIRMNQRDRGAGTKPERFKLTQQNSLLRGMCGDCLDEKPRKRGA